MEVLSVKQIRYLVCSEPVPTLSREIVHCIEVQVLVGVSTNQAQQCKFLNLIYSLNSYVLHISHTEETRTTYAVVWLSTPLHFDCFPDCACAGLLRGVTQPLMALWGLLFFFLLYIHGDLRVS